MRIKPCRDGIGIGFLPIILALGLDLGSSNLGSSDLGSSNFGNGYNPS
ncbi:hypothetical protein OG921_11105 [Aldersonia sp. NBC_00410]|nr:hypothetical protein [Aldersonia sp. NBC_00410]MCX5043713.1 hypothetical protein [Aldersonia sp. NBC_00410]